jgi:hypothetical protein
MNVIGIEKPKVKEEWGEDCMLLLVLFKDGFMTISPHTQPLLKG